jgi:hypothetical protein
MQTTQLPAAHGWTEQCTVLSIQRRQSTVIANTFLSIDWLLPFVDIALDYGANLRVIEMRDHHWDDPRMLAAMMRKKFEPLKESSLADMIPWTCEDAPPLLPWADGTTLPYRCQPGTCAVIPREGNASQ